MGPYIAKILALNNLYFKDVGTGRRKIIVSSRNFNHFCWQQFIYAHISKWKKNKLQWCNYSATDYFYQFILFLPRTYEADGGWKMEEQIQMLRVSVILYFPRTPSNSSHSSWIIPIVMLTNGLFLLSSMESPLNVSSSRRVEHSRNNKRV